MTTILTILLIVHIISGFLALLAGLFAMVAAKGKKVHRISGLVFYYSMLSVVISAFVISVVKNNQFLLMIAIFSFYQVYSGFRAIKNKSLKPNVSDRLFLVLAAVNTFFMIYSLNIVLMVFGGISASMVIGNFRANFILKKGGDLPKMAWLAKHIGMMVGGYIATITAFIVVNHSVFDFMNLPSWLPWLTPTIILVPLIFYWTRKYTGQKIGAKVDEEKAK